jgi:hypothetical protein
MLATHPDFEPSPGQNQQRAVLPQTVKTWTSWYDDRLSQTLRPFIRVSVVDRGLRRWHAQ